LELEIIELNGKKKVLENELKRYMVFFFFLLELFFNHRLIQMLPIDSKNCFQKFVKMRRRTEKKRMDI
jgi:hypothetical protein